MKTGAYCCFVCGKGEFGTRTPEYRRCSNCGHESLIGSDTQGLILNDPLTEKSVTKATALDRFKARVVQRFDQAPERGQLLDIGSASGKFLLLNGPRYRRAIGLEITPEAVAFSRQVLHLDIKENMRDVPAGTTLATAWHSLEHIPEHALTDALDILSRRMAAGGRLIVSVPNADSRQYRWFGRSYAYFDVPNHLHQFSVASLEILLGRFGFGAAKVVNSWPYNAFGYTQSLLNVVTNTHNYLYYRLKRRTRLPSLALDLVHALLLPILVPAGWVLGLVDAIDPKRQGVITVCFEKSPS